MKFEERKNVWLCVSVERMVKCKIARLVVRLACLFLIVLLSLSFFPLPLFAVLFIFYFFLFFPFLSDPSSSSSPFSSPCAFLLQLFFFSPVGLDEVQFFSRSSNVNECQIPLSIRVRLIAIHVKHYNTHFNNALHLALSLPLSCIHTHSPIQSRNPSLPSLFPSPSPPAILHWSSASEDVGSQERKQICTASNACERIKVAQSRQKLWERF